MKRGPRPIYKKAFLLVTRNLVGGYQAFSLSSMYMATPTMVVHQTRNPIASKGFLRSAKNIRAENLIAEGSDISNTILNTTIPNVSIFSFMFMCTDF